MEGKKLFQFVQIVKKKVVGYTIGKRSADPSSADVLLHAWEAEDPANRKLKIIPLDEKSPLQIEPKYLKVEAGEVVEMDATEKAAVDKADEDDKEVKKGKITKFVNDIKAKLKTAIPSLTDDEIEFILGQKKDLYTRAKE